MNTRMLLLVLWCATLSTEARAAPSTSVRDAETSLLQAQALAARREHAAAIDAYRGVLATGHDGAALRYNLGTMLLERGELGEATLHLLTARRLSPTDDDVAHNLSVAQEARTDRLAGDSSEGPVLAVGRQLAPKASRAMLGGALALLGVACGLLAWRQRTWTRMLTLSSLALVLITGALFGCRITLERTEEAVVLVERASAKKAPDIAANESFVAHAGLSGVVVEDQGPWVRLRMDNGLDAWFERTAIGFVGATSGPP